MFIPFPSPPSTYVRYTHITSLRSVKIVSRALERGDDCGGLLYMLCLQFYTQQTKTHTHTDTTYFRSIKAVLIGKCVRIRYIIFRGQRKMQYTTREINRYVASRA